MRGPSRAVKPVPRSQWNAAFARPPIVPGGYICRCGFPPNYDILTAIHTVRFTSIRDVAQTSQMRKEQPFPDGLANLWIDPKATFGFEASRSESERKRSSREGTIAT